MVIAGMNEKIKQMTAQWELSLKNFKQIELLAKLFDYFLWSNKINVNWIEI